MLRNTLRSEVRDLRTRVADAEALVRVTADECRIMREALAAAYEAAGSEVRPAPASSARHLYLVTAAPDR